MQQILSLIELAINTLVKLVFIAITLAATYAGWRVLGAFDVAGIMRGVGAVATGLAALILAWLAWRLMNIFWLEL